MAVIINNILGREGMRLIGGNVKSISEGTGLAEGKVVNLTLSDGTQVAFWNNSAREMANRIRKANVKIGSFISILAMFRETNKANAINFKYNGIWEFEEDVKKITPSSSGVITNIHFSDDEATVELDGKEKIIVRNVEKGYRFAERLKNRKPAIGDKFAVIKQDEKLINFAVNDTWEINRSVSAIIGNVAFIDETISPSGKPRIKVNVSIFDHKDKKTGDNIYRNCYVYFDNENNASMIDSIKEKLKPHTSVAIVGKRNNNTEKDIFTGFYFINI